MTVSRVTICGLCVVMSLCVAQVAMATTAIDLNTWAKKGPSSYGSWTVQGGGASVYQSINGNPTFFVSPDNYINTTFDGKFKVETSYDDDYIGFVFGYQTPTGTGTDYDFILFDWKQGLQSGSPAGLTLARVNGTNTIPFGNHHLDQFSGAYDVWQTKNGSGFSGWADNTEYDFTLTYQSNRIKIDIKGGTGDYAAGKTIFDVTPTDVGAASFPDGKFGFYNYSQQAVRYQGFTEEAAPPIPEPLTMLAMGLAISGVGTYIRKRRMA